MPRSIVRASWYLGGLLTMLALGAPARHAAAQVVVEYSEEAERQFRDAVALYDAGAFREAAGRFELLMRDFPTSHRVTAAFVMRGKAFCLAGENLEAAKSLKAFIARHPESTYIPDAEYTLGVVYARIERWEEAMEMYLTAFSRLGPSSPPRLIGEITAAMDSTIRAHVSLFSLRAWLARAGSPAERAYLWMVIAEQEAAGENSVQAGIALDSLDGRYPGHAYAARAAAIRLRISAQSSVALGVLLPLMTNHERSAVKEVGTEVFDGVSFAVEEFTRRPGMRVAVRMEVRDTERDPQVASRGAQELAAIHEVIGIIGPVFSATVGPAAAAANARGVPLISPTANANGLAATGKYVFQANPDYDARGRAMARYAVEQRGFRTLAVLAPVDAYGKFLAEGFVSEAERLGARVLATEWYQRGSSDLKQPLARIRRAGMLASPDARITFAGRMKPTTLMKLADLGVPLRRIDSLLNAAASIGATALLGPRARQRLDSADVPVSFDESRVDSLEYPVDAIEALYVPIAGPEEIGVVSSQVVYFNVQTQLLGSGEWFNVQELSANRRYCDGVVFESDTYVDTAAADFHRFVEGFTARFHKRPTKNALFGYDTGALVLDLIARGATSRELLQRALDDLTEYRGFHARIGLNDGRVNTWVMLLKYTQDEIRKVGEIHAPAPPEGGGNVERIVH
ncbi:MAG: ABC transporter substrate-binding protein [Bacteroidota bacterium]